MKGCELCGGGGGARMFCESDQASLCWDCDEKVHGANFLVAKHCRTLLCHICQLPTPWTASGPNLTPTISMCHSCFSVHGGDDGGGGAQSQSPIFPSEEEATTSMTAEEQEEFSDDEYATEEEEDEDEDENQVVPWSGESYSGAGEQHISEMSYSEGENGRSSSSSLWDYDGRRLSTEERGSDSCSSSSCRPFKLSGRGGS